MNKKFNIKEWKDTYLKEGSLDSDSVSTMLDIAARWSSTQDQAAAAIDSGAALKSLKQFGDITQQ